MRDILDSNDDVLLLWRPPANQMNCCFLLLCFLSYEQTSRASAQAVRHTKASSLISVPLIINHLRFWRSNESFRTVCKILHIHNQNLHLLYIWGYRRSKATHNNAPLLIFYIVILWPSSLLSTCDWYISCERMELDVLFLLKIVLCQKYIPWTA